MHILIPSYTFTTDLTPTQNAVAYIAYIGADVWDFSSGRISIWIMRSFEAANTPPYKSPAEVLELTPGQILVEGVQAVEYVPAIVGNPEASPPIQEYPAVEAVEGVEEVRMPTVLEIDNQAKELMQSSPGLSPMQAFGAVIYTHALNHPKLQGATLVN